MADKRIDPPEAERDDRQSQNASIGSEAKSEITDADQIPAWARPYLTAAVEAKLVQGRGQGLFAPRLMLPVPNR